MTYQLMHLPAAGLVLALEGGYNERVIAECSAACVQVHLTTYRSRPLPCMPRNGCIPSVAWWFPKEQLQRGSRATSHHGAGRHSTGELHAPFLHCLAVLLAQMKTSDLCCQGTACLLGAMPPTQYTPSALHLCMHAAQPWGWQVVHSSQGAFEINSKALSAAACVDAAQGPVTTCKHQSTAPSCPGSSAGSRNAPGTPLACPARCARPLSAAGQVLLGTAHGAGTAMVAQPGLMRRLTEAGLTMPWLLFADQVLGCMHQ